jgi:hypothetical protein
MRAFVSSWAERLPLRINSSSWARSSALGLSRSIGPVRPRWSFWRCHAGGPGGLVSARHRGARAGVFGEAARGFAQVDGAFWGYFFSHSGGATATIKRVPLTGGAATVLATVTDVDVANSHRNLVTDGVNLYWQDAQSVRKMPIRGGAVTVLDEVADAQRHGAIIVVSAPDREIAPRPNLLDQAEIDQLGD